MKNIKNFHRTYLALIVFSILAVSNMAAGVADWFPGSIVIIAIGVYLLTNVNKFKRAAAVINKLTPEPEDDPMTLEV